MKKREMLKHVVNGEMSDFKDTFNQEVDSRVGQESAMIRDNVRAEFGNAPAGDGGNGEDE